MYLRGASMNLKKVRISKKISQAQAAEALGVSLRSYASYENDTSKVDSMKYEFMINKLNELYLLDEDNGLLTIEEIKSCCKIIFEKYNIEFCYLFGSYAKGIATEKSDIDLLISCDIKGLKYYALVEELREVIKKRLDILEIKQLENNIELTHEILKSGVKIYG